MLSYAREIVARVEKEAILESRDDAALALQELGFDDFGELLITMPNRDYPRLSALLPAMASDEIQKTWTGSTGIVLLHQTCSFARSVAFGYSFITGKPFKDRRLLDFGCGYGRIARSMMYFSKPSLLWGVDPSPFSLKYCRDCQMGDQFLQSEFLPTSLPVSGQFDLIYACSVFTHLSKRACLTALSVLREYIRDDGLLAITVRPLEFWAFRHQRKPGAPVEILTRAHETEGYAFDPHNSLKPVDGDLTYGDTTMTLEWLRTNAPQWKLEMVDRSLEDPFQIYIFLTPR